jgi:hypothetical protein
METDNLIADFLGWKIDEDSGNYMVPILFIINGDYKEWADTKHVDDIGYYLLSENQMEFHRDWNWLMGVVEHIKSQHGKNGFVIHSFSFGLDFINIRIELNRRFFNGVEINVVTSDFKEKVYEALVRFIVWYNEQKEKV